MAFAIDLFCGLGGWSEGLLAEGWDVVGFDIKRHQYGDHCYPAQLVIQDVLTLHGSQFRDADLIVASPPCQAYSYMAMPWKLAKARAAAIRADTSGRMLADLNSAFDACFRVQAQASLAAGRHIPMVVENVRGAQPWVGRARWNFGSYYLWGDVPALMPIGGAIKVRPFRFDGSGSFRSAMVRQGVKAPGQDWNRHAITGEVSPHWRIQGLFSWNRNEEFQRSCRTSVDSGARFTSRDCGVESRWFNDGQRSPDSISSSSSSSLRRKAASAMIARIPVPLARHIAKVYRV